MAEYDIEDVHRLLDATEEGIRELSVVSSKSVKMDDIPVLCGVVMEVLGWERAAWRNSLGISPSILTRFTQMRGSVSKTDAMKVANRIKTFLKSEDQGYTLTPPTLIIPPARRQDVIPTLSIRAEQWVSVPSTSEMKKKISALSAILDSIIQQAGRSNAPEEEGSYPD